MGSHAVFRRLVHFPGADLHLKGDTLVADDRGVQGLVHVGLGSGDIVLEPAGHQVEQVVDMAQDVIAVGDGVHDDPEGVEIVQLVHGFVLILQLAVDGVDVLNAAIDLALDAHALQPLGDLVLNGLHELVVLILVGGQIIYDFLISLGIQILQGDILQLPFELLHTKTVGQGRVDLHGLRGFGNLLGRRLVFQSAHVVQPVGDFDQDHPDVLAHGHEHLAQIFHLLLLGGGEVDPGQLGDALHQLGHRGAEKLDDFVIAGVGVLQAVMEQGRQDGVGVQADFHYDFRHGQRVDDIGFAALAQLLFVLGVGKTISLVHQGNIRGGRVAGDGS